MQHPDNGCRSDSIPPKRKTGPCTPEGLERCRRSTLRHGLRSAPFIRLRKAIAAHRKSSLSFLGRLQQSGGDQVEAMAGTISAACQYPEALAEWTTFAKSLPQADQRRNMPMDQTNTHKMIARCPDEPKHSRIDYK